MPFFKRRKKNNEDAPITKAARKEMPLKKAADPVYQKGDKTIPAPYGAIITHHLTEKTSNAAARENKFVFLIEKNANKHQVKRDVEARFRVEVERVNIINLPGKERRRANLLGWKPGVRKAVVTVKKGQVIEIQ